MALKSYVFALNHAISAEEPRMWASALELLGDNMKFPMETSMKIIVFFFQYPLVICYIAIENGHL